MFPRRREFKGLSNANKELKLYKETIGRKKSMERRIEEVAVMDKGR